ncbi:hypothetical protein G6O69_27160 [Pseudenhygromyxa sp. WMMC2535]|uniref:hypothetical protein n=1 Tax=Pseudenhygromyxa sp. WMMC2535 TaxID=2712867 RepID=UPI0015953FBF|nr:hypothetical protein [Pseudenhygromyxa sp. WMMC2535]NVB41548.1 hypothetical protein [Pseudenhygromyxa sp. WMMC2535]
MSMPPRAADHSHGSVRRQAGARTHGLWGAFRGQGLRPFLASVHPRCVTFAVPAPSRRLTITTLSIGLSLALGSLVSADALAAPSPAAQPEALDDPDAPEAAPEADSADADSSAPETPAPAADGDPANPDASDGDLGAIDDVSADPDPEAEVAEVAEVDEVDDDQASVEDETFEPEAPPPEEDPDPAVIRPPRIDGPYVGGVAFGSVSFASVLNLDTPSPFGGGGVFVQAGDAVFPWMSVGIAVGGQVGLVSQRPRQRLVGGSLLVELGFMPLHKLHRPLSIRVGFGFGGGTIREAGAEDRSGFGGASFKGSLRYEFFPLAERKRPDRGGGWAIGPELGWLGATPAAKGQPFVNTILLGLSTSLYFGS